MATVPPNATDGRALSYNYYNIHVTLDLIASSDIQNLNGGYAKSKTYYYGGNPYMGEDSGDYQAIMVTGRRHHAVQITSKQNNSYSVQFEASLDGVTWSNAQVAFTADSLYNFTGLYKFVRFNVTALNNSGSVASVTLGSGGTGYGSVPTVTFTAPQDPLGVTAKGTAVLTLGVVTSVTITEPGSGYTSAPTVSFTGANTTPASGTAVLTAGTLDITKPYGLKINYLAVA